jgi:hypothetical protein
MSYEIRELVIKLDTNIKGDKPIDFNGNMLYFPEEENISQVGGKPYICVDIKYTDELLSLIDETDRYKFFFNKSYLMSVLDKYKDKNETESDDKDEHMISKHNIMFCIKTIFPTKYYTINNIHQSIQLKYPSGAVPYRSHYWFNPFNTKNAYLKIGATEYTVAKVTWLNDVLNHPEYKELLDVTSNVLGNYNRDIKQSAYIIRKHFETYKNKLLDLYRDAYYKNNKFATESIFIGDNSADHLSLMKSLVQYFIKDPQEIEQTKNFIIQVGPKPDHKIFKDQEKLNDLKDLLKSTNNMSADSNSDISDIFRRQGGNNNNVFLNGRTIEAHNKFFSVIGKIQEVIDKIINKNYEIIKNDSSEYLYTTLESSPTIIETSVLNDDIKKKLFDKDKLIDNYNMLLTSGLVTDNNVLYKNDNMINYFNVIRLFTEMRTNTELDDILLDLQVPDNETVKKAILRLTEILNIIHKGTNKEDNLKLLDIGSNTITVDGVQKNEIYVHLDLIQGIVNDDNKNDVFCHYTNRLLGDKLDKITSGHPDWMVSEHMELVEVKKTEKSDITMLTKAEQIVQDGFNKVSQVIPTTTSISQDKDNKEKDARLQRYLTGKGITKVKYNNTIEPGDKSVLEFIQKKNGQLYKLLLEYEKLPEPKMNNINKPNSVINNIELLDTTYKKIIEQNKSKLNNKLISTKNKQEITKNNLENQLYIDVIHSFIPLKQGGKKRHTKRKSRIVSKQNKKRHTKKQYKNR